MDTSRMWPPSRWSQFVVTCIAIGLMAAFTIWFMYVVFPLILRLNLVWPEEWSMAKKSQRIQPEDYDEPRLRRAAWKNSRWYKFLVMIGMAPVDDGDVVAQLDHRTMTALDNVRLHTGTGPGAKVRLKGTPGSKEADRAALVAFFVETHKTDRLNWSSETGSGGGRQVRERALAIPLPCA